MPATMRERREGQIGAPAKSRRDVCSASRTEVEGAIRGAGTQCKAINHRARFGGLSAPLTRALASEPISAILSESIDEARSPAHVFALCTRLHEDDGTKE